MFTQRLTEVNLVGWDCTTQCMHVCVGAAFVALLFRIKDFKEISWELYID